MPRQYKQMHFVLGKILLYFSKDIKIMTRITLVIRSYITL